jgi:hypothetical protein
MASDERGRKPDRPLSQEVRAQRRRRVHTAATDKRKNLVYAAASAVCICPYRKLSV